MFDNLIESSPSQKARPRTALFVSIIVHSIAVLAVVIIPLIYYHALPERDLWQSGLLTFLVPPPPPPPPPFAIAWVPPEEPEDIPEAPDDIPTISSIGFSLGGVVGGITGGVVGGVSGSALGGVVGGVPVAPVPPSPTPEKEPIRVGGKVQASKLIHRVEPVYPELARKARVSGVVLLQVTVDEQGGVAEVKLVSGHPLLNRAAVNAVCQWKYSPMLLNGQPVQVVSTVTVSFVLKFVESLTSLLELTRPGTIQWSLG